MVDFDLLESYIIFSLKKKSKPVQINFENLGVVLKHPVIF